MTRSWVDDCKLPFGDSRAIRMADRTQCSQYIQKYAQISTYEQLDRAKQFCHRSCVVQIDQLSLVALSHPAMKIVYGEDNELRNNLSIPFLGVNRSFLTQDLFSVQPGQALFKPIANDAVVETSDYIGVSFLFSTSLMERVVLAFDPSGASQQKLHSALTRPALFSCENQVQRILLHQLQCLMSLMESGVDGNGHVPAQLHFEDLYAARVATLLLPELVSNDSQPDHAWAYGKVDPRFDELIEYIGANPSLPLSLTDLSVQSGLSRDQLNQYFRYRFGMGPMRWIRDQRIQRLNRMLEH